jgi:ectoine hydroxylase-related dioxygenase (phytanoyl-CoA dioxygenase family)
MISLAAATGALKADGYVILPDLISQETIAGLNADLEPRFAATPFCEGQFYGVKTKRFGGLLKRSRHAAALVQNKLILEIAEAILGPYCDRFQLNLTQALELHPGQGRQAPHRDQNMWRGPVGEIEYLINIMWPLTPYNETNGGTLLWPDSHRADRYQAAAQDQPITAEMDVGAALVFLGSTLHSGGANRANTPRRGIIVSYCLGWLKPYENQWLVYPPDIARTFSPDLAALVGYQQHRPNLGNYEGQCPSILLRSALVEHLAAKDELRPEQAAALAAYMAEHFQADRAA